MPSRIVAGQRPISAASSPERQPSEHSRLAMPRGRGFTSTQPISRNTSAGWDGWREEVGLELDGEWLGDAAPPLEPSIEKEREESPAMNLLLSITRAAATAVPGLSPRPGGLVERSRLRRPRGGSVGGPTRDSSSGSVGNSFTSPPGEFYRLPWYRRPLPPPIPGSASGAAYAARRSSTPYSSRRAGQGRRSGFEHRALESFVASPSGYEGLEDVESRRQSRSSPLRAPADREFEAPAELTVDAALTPDPPLTIAPRRPVENPSSLRVAAAAAASAAMKAGEAAAKGKGKDKDRDRAAHMPAVTAFPSTIAEAIVVATPAVNSMEADRNPACDGAGHGREGNAFAEEDYHRAESEENRRLANQVHQLKNEVDRLKREMASMAAAAASAVTPAEVGGSSASVGTRASSNASPIDEAKTPAPFTKVSPLQLNASSEKKPSPSPDGSSRSMPGRPSSRALRPDDSWLHARRSSGDSSCNGLDKGARVGSTLPILASDGTGDADGNDTLSYSSEITPTRRGSHVVCEGPSPASGEKITEDLAAAAAASAAAEGRGDCADGDNASSPGDGDCGVSSARSLRPFPVFFPVQEPPAEPVETLAMVSAMSSRGGSTVGARPQEMAATAAAAAPTHGKHGSVGETKTNGSPRQDAAAEKAPAARVECSTHAKSVSGAVEATAASAEATATTSSKADAYSKGRRRRDSNSDGQEWRWVLAQRTGNERVRQALLSHGLPPSKRRSIWGAWAALAHPESCARAKARVASNLAAQGSITSVIAHDVQRTKMGHPLFSAGGQGMDMLKRVLLRCAELGAVKEAGYIQGMNYLAGFLLVTIADAVVAERETNEDGDPGAANGGTVAPGGASAGATLGGVTLTAELQVAAVKEAVVRAGGKRGTEAMPREVEVIETECVQVMLGMIALQGGVLSRDLWGLHANTELVEELLSKYCPDIMDHLRSVKLELIVLTPRLRWFICVYAGSMASQTLVARIWDLYLWYGRRGPAVLVWVALSLLHGCRRHVLESTSLPAAVKTVRRHAEGCKTFDDLLRQAPVSIYQVVAAWEEKGSNRRIASLDGEDLLPDKMVGGLVQEMSGELVINIHAAPSGDGSSPQPKHRRSTTALPPVTATSTPAGFGIQFPSTPGRPPTPLTSPRSPFPEWAANIFRSSTGGGGGPIDVEGVTAAANATMPVAMPVAAAGREKERERERPPISPRFDNGASVRGEGRGRPFRRAASSSWW